MARIRFRKSYNPFFLILILSMIIFGGLSYYFLYVKNKTSPAKIANPYTNSTNKSTDSEVVPATDSSSETAEPIIPASAILKVPFQVQAPDANWDALHEEACEEASLIMVAHYIKQTDVGGEQEIQDLIKWEGENGYAVDLTLTQLAEVAKKRYKISGGQVKKEVTAEKIKAEIAAGHPVIVPAAGKVLPNPYFSNDGPNYHMLVIIGYDETEFITNDPGTKRGEGFKYKYDDLISAVHDWDSENILNGQKAYLVFD